MLSQLKSYASFVRFSHSVFALPFALIGVLLAARQHPVGWAQVLWIVVAMVAARSAAMGFNRLVDARYDALNPRTAAREIPRGLVTPGAARMFVLVSSVLFVYAAFRLGRLCFLLSPVALGIAFWYSLAKRYTSYAQGFLGVAMAVAPVGGWLAAGGGWGLEPVVLGFAIGTWVAGFDVLYACQDLGFDRHHGLRSIPEKFGVRSALVISRALHVVTIGSLAALYWVVPFGRLYLPGVGLITALLAYEQSLVTEHDLSQVKRAFDLNGYVGILYLLITAISIYVP